jgi:hypothetical protein
VRYGLQILINTEDADMATKQICPGFRIDSNTGTSIISGPLTIQSGTLRVQNLVVR